jgi:hypothetical protein
VTNTPAKNYLMPSEECTSKEFSGQAKNTLKYPGEEHSDEEYSSDKFSGNLFYKFNFKIDRENS